MWCCIATVLLGVWMDLANGMINIQLTPQFPVIHGSVILSVTDITEKIISITWFKGPTSSSDNQIYVFLPGDNSTLVHGPRYNSQITNFPNGSLQISNLLASHKGKYIIKIQTKIRALESSVNLIIYDPVSKPNITASNFMPQENENITFMCTSSNAERIIWSKDGGSLHPRAELSSDNKTINLLRINRSDSGHYQCTAANIASEKISDSYTLTIAYGPENVNITGPSQVKEGSVISLECIADSVPSPIYSWKFNGRNLTLPHNHTLLIEKITSMNEGNYSCQVKNLVTKCSASASILITVIEPFFKNEVLIGLISGVVLALVLILIAVVKLCKRFFTKHENEQQTSNEIPEQEIYANVGNMYFKDNIIY